jgi:hypothetical protein
MTEKQQKIARTSAAVASAWEQRTLLVKQERAATNAANDAKTARLRALRLERDRQEANAKPPDTKPARKSSASSRANTGKR